MKCRWDSTAFKITILHQGCLSLFVLSPSSQSTRVVVGLCWRLSFGRLWRLVRFSQLFLLRKKLRFRLRLHQVYELWEIAFYGSWTFLIGIRWLLLDWIFAFDDYSKWDFILFIQAELFCFEINIYPWDIVLNYFFRYIYVSYAMVRLHFFKVPI